MKLIGLIILLVLLASCRGELSEKPPIHMNLNMDFQTKKMPQRYSENLPEGVVGFGYKADADKGSREDFIQSDPAYYTGKVNGSYVKRVPAKVDKTFIEKGQKNYNIYCAVCHDKVGTGKGLVITRGVGFPPPPMFTDPRILAMTDGEFFEIITVGRRNMPSYATQVEVEDRWAIVSYLRALQAARTASVDDVPGGITSLKK